MNKKIILTLGILLIILKSNAQYFEPVGMGIGMDLNVTEMRTDTIHHKLLIGGHFLHVDTIPVSGGCFWDGNSYHSMPGIGISSYWLSSTMWNGYNVFAIDLGVHLFDSTMYVPFNFPLLLSGPADITDVISYNDTLYIGGGFYLQDGTYGLAKWNGTDWEGVGGSITSGPTGNIQCLGVYNGDLIAAGSFDEMGGVAANHIARWDGAQWHAMGAGVDPDFGNSPHIQSMLEFNGELYVSGDNLNSTSSNLTGIMKWDGNVWSAPQLYGNIGGTEMKVYHNKLYIGGAMAIYDSGGNNLGGTVLIRYDGNIWNSFISWYPYGGIIRAMDTFENYLYVGGDFSSLGSVYCNKIARFSDDSVVCFPPVIETNGDTLFVNETGYFHWLNCNDGSIIAGATSNTYVPDTTGNYAVIVTSGGCNDTTECVSFTGINELQTSVFGIMLYPNPTEGSFYLEVKSDEDDAEALVNLYDLSGKRILSSAIQFNNGVFSGMLTVPENVSDGLYFVEVKSATLHELKKLIIQKL